MLFGLISKAKSFAFGGDRHADSSIEFISMTTHQLQTPLAVVRAQLSMINDGDYGEIPEALHTALLRLQTSSDQMREMVEVMLKTTRLTSGKIQLNFKSQNIVTLSQQVIADLQPMATKQNVVIHEKYDLLQPEVVLESSLYTDILQTFLHNAIKYSPIGGDISLSIYQDDDSNIKLAVSDCGIGVPAEQASNLFTQYFRATNANRAEIPGTGLGLYHAKLCAQKLNAKVGYIPNLPNGSTFWLKIFKS